MAAINKSLTRRSSALVRRGLETVNRLADANDQNPGDKNFDNAGEDTGKETNLTDWLTNYLEKKGAVAEVGALYYYDFVNLSDDEMESLIKLVISINASNIQKTNRP